MTPTHISDRILGELRATVASVLDATIRQAMRAPQHSKPQNWMVDALERFMPTRRRDDLADMMAQVSELYGAVPSFPCCNPCLRTCKAELARLRGMLEAFSNLRARRADAISTDLASAAQGCLSAVQESTST